MELSNHLAEDEHHARCQKCDTTYERYTIFFTKDEPTLAKREFVRDVKGLDKLCKDCFVEEMEPHKGFALS